MSFTIDQLLIFACRAGNLALVRERIEAGANLNYVDETHGSPLLEAVRANNVGLIDFLIQNGADLKVANKHQNGPIEIAVHNGCKEALALLIQRGAEMVNPGHPKLRKALEQFRRTGALGKGEPIIQRGTRVRQSLSAREHPREARFVPLAAGRDWLCGCFRRGLGNARVYRARHLRRWG